MTSPWYARSPVGAPQNQCDLPTGGNRSHVSRHSAGEQKSGEAVEIIAEHIRDEKTAHQIKAIPDMLETLGIVLSLMDESSGVVGYHLNGEVATWEELGIREEVESAIRKARGEE